MTTPRDDIAGLIKRLREESEYLAEEVGVQFTLLISENEALKAALIRAEQERDALQARVKEYDAAYDGLMKAKEAFRAEAHRNAERALRAEQERDEAYERADGLIDAISHAEDILSKHIEEFHDFDYEPHQIPQELSQLNGIRHHLLGSLIDEKGEPIRRLASGPEKEKE